MAKGAQTRKTVTCFVCLWPARRALGSWGVHGLRPWIAEPELGEAFARVVASLIDAFAWPACVALAVGRRAVWAQRLAS
jgi:hypothetical protein